MKSYETLQSEAEKVLEQVGAVIKSTCEHVVGDKDISALSSLVDSYSRLYEEIK